MTRRRSVAVVALVALALMAAGCGDGAPAGGGAAPTAPPGTPVPSHSLLEKVPDGGRLRVIVSLPWPGGRSAPPPDREHQVRAVAQAQEELIEALRPYRGATVTTRYRIYPMLAMEVDRQALAFLLTSPKVKSVHENRTLSTH